MIKKYKEYKLSKFKWFEHVPVNWHEGKISYFFEIGRGRVISELELNPDAPYPVYSSQTKNDGCLGFIDTYDFDDNILTWTTDGANAGTVFIRSGKFNCTNVCGTLKPKVNVDLKYYLYYLQTMTPFYKRPDTNGAKIMNNEMARIYCLIPPVQEQNKIAQYLDHQTAIIDQLIHQKEKLIELLKEKRQAVINEAVTKGLNPNAKMKDTGIELLGEIPEHWKISKVKWHLEFCNNKRVPLEAAERYNRKGQYPYYGASGIIDHVDDFLFDGDFILVGEDGANILSRSTPLAFIAKGKFWVNNHAHILRVPYGEIDYFCEQLELNDYSTIASGSAQPKLTKEALGNIRIAIPSKDEQTLIVEYVNGSNKIIDDTCSKIFSQIEKLKEYRQSIISEAVTGKIDVRGWQPNKQKVA